MESKIKIYGEAESFIRSKFLSETMDYECKFDLHTF